MSKLAAAKQLYLEAKATFYGTLTRANRTLAEAHPNHPEADQLTCMICSALLESALLEPLDLPGTLTALRKAELALIESAIEVRRESPYWKLIEKQIARVIAFPGPRNIAIAAALLIEE